MFVTCIYMYSIVFYCIVSSKQVLCQNVDFGRLCILCAKVHPTHTKSIDHRMMDDGLMHVVSISIVILDFNTVLSIT